MTALDGATVKFRDGQVNALIGPNGSGKTTFFNCVTGMIRAGQRADHYRDSDITRKAPHAIARAGVGRTFQLCRVFPADDGAGQRAGGGPAAAASSAGCAARAPAPRSTGPAAG